MTIKTKEHLHVDTIVEIKIKTPPKYKVIFLNDDFTPFEFVESLLTIIFNKTKVQAKAIALKIHQEGKAVVGIYIKEIASTKKQIVDTNSLKNEYPLECLIEED